jgi:hypothetical protein
LVVAASSFLRGWAHFGAPFDDLTDRNGEVIFWMGEPSSTRGVVEDVTVLDPARHHQVLLGVHDVLWEGG